MNSQTISPVQEKQRIEFIDILRGFALFGVLVINIYTFSQPPSGHIGSSYTDIQGVQKIVVWVINILITGKFYTIFAFLFGLGFAIQIERMKNKTDKYISIYVRRLFILLIIGFVHAIFLYTGDILKLYALNGFLLLLFRNSSPKKLIRWSVGLFSILIVLFIGTFIAEGVGAGKTTNPVNETENVTNTPQKNQKEIWAKTYATGNFIDIAKTRFEVFLGPESLSMYIISPFLILPLFLMGAYFGKKQIFQNLKAHQKLFKKIQIAGLVLGVILSILLIVQSIFFNDLKGGSENILQSFLHQLNCISIASFWFASCVLLFIKNKLNFLYHPLKCMGQTALSNYLLQSILFGLLMYNYGFGLLGKFNVTVLFFIASAIFVFQAYLSVLWMQKYRFGPAEWLWRSLTYKKRQPMKKI